MMERQREGGREGGREIERGGRRERPPRDAESGRNRSVHDWSIHVL